MPIGSEQHIYSSEDDESGDVGVPSADESHEEKEIIEEEALDKLEKPILDYEKIDKLVGEVNHFLSIVEENDNNPDFQKILENYFDNLINSFKPEAVALYRKRLSVREKFIKMDERALNEDEESELYDFEEKFENETGDFTEARFLYHLGFAINQAAEKRKEVLEYQNTYETKRDEFRKNISPYIHHFFRDRTSGIIKEDDYAARFDGISLVILLKPREGWFKLAYPSAGCHFNRTPISVLFDGKDNDHVIAHEKDHNLADLLTFNKSEVEIIGISMRKIETINKHIDLNFPETIIAHEKRKLSKLIDKFFDIAANEVMAEVASGEKIGLNDPEKVEKYLIQRANGYLVQFKDFNWEKIANVLGYSQEEAYQKFMGKKAKRLGLAVATMYSAGKADYIRGLFAVLPFSNTGAWVRISRHVAGENKDTSSNDDVAEIDEELPAEE